MDIYLIQAVLKVAHLDSMETVKIIVVEVVILLVLNVVVVLSHNVKDAKKDSY